jgi:hypothetical protein
MVLCAVGRVIPFGADVNDRLRGRGRGKTDKN